MDIFESDAPISEIKDEILDTDDSINKTKNKVTVAGNVCVSCEG